MLERGTSPRVLVPRTGEPTQVATPLSARPYALAGAGSVFLALGGETNEATSRAMRLDLAGQELDGQAIDGGTLVGDGNGFLVVRSSQHERYRYDLISLDGGR